MKFRSFFIGRIQLVNFLNDVKKYRDVFLHHLRNISSTLGHDVFSMILIFTKYRNFAQRISRC